MIKILFSSFVAQSQNKLAVRLCRRYIKSRRKSLKKSIIGVIISGIYSLRYTKGSNGNKNGAKTTHINFIQPFCLSARRRNKIAATPTPHVQGSFCFFFVEFNTKKLKLYYVKSIYRITLSIKNCIKYCYNPSEWCHCNNAKSP